MADVHWQFRHDVVRDVQARILNSDLLSHLAISSPLSRVVVAAVPPLRLKAHWSDPVLDHSESLVRHSDPDRGGLNRSVDALNLSVEVFGGVRETVEGVNYTLRGRVSAAYAVGTGRRGGRPVATLVRPSLSAMDLTQLELTYEGGTQTPPAALKLLLPPALHGLIVAPLAELPLTYAPRHAYVTGDAWTASVTADAVCLASEPGPHPELLPPSGSPANAAVGMSVAALNAALEHIRRTGLATGVAEANGRRCDWRWLSVQAELTADGVRLAGWLSCDGEVGRRQVEVDCVFAGPGYGVSTEPGRFVVTSVATGCSAVAAPAAVGLLRRVFCEPAGPLDEYFDIPGTEVSIAAALVDVAPVGELLVARYDIPLWSAPVTLEIDSASPQPIVVQPFIPQQGSPGAPVSAPLIATLPRAPEPPYEFVWRTDRAPEETQRGASISLAAIPSDPNRLGHVSLTVIDMLGRAGQAEADVAYIPAELQARPDENQPIRPSPARPLRPSEFPSRSLEIPASRREEAQSSADLPGRLRRWWQGIAATGAVAVFSVAAAVDLGSSDPEAGVLPPAGIISSATGSPAVSSSASPMIKLPIVGASPSRSVAPTRKPTKKPSPKPSPSPPPLAIGTEISVGVCAPASTCDPVPDCPGCPAAYKGPCEGGVTVHFTSTVSVNTGPVSVRFRWILNDKAFTEDAITFTGKGSHVVSTTTVVDVSSGPWTGRIEITDPQPTLSDVVSATIVCAEP